MDDAVYGPGRAFRYAWAMVRTAVPLILSLAATACNIVPSRVPLGEMFPSGVARSLDGHEVRFPDALAEGPIVLTIAYENDADRDAERWLEALAERKLAIRGFRMHVTPGTLGILLSPLIDAGERDAAGESGRGNALVAYGDLADRIATQTGMGKAEFARVLLVRTDGTIAWFCDTGFAPDRIDDLAAAIVNGPR